MKAWHFWHFMIYIFLFGGGSSCMEIHGQRALSVQAQWGKSIANHPAYPALQPWVGALELQYLSWNPKYQWARLYPKSQLGVILSVQQTGNREVLGTAWALAPVLHWQLLERSNWSWGLELGLGLGYLSRRFDSFANPQNIVIGSALNAYARARLQASYRLGPWRPQLAFMVSHYSNGNYRSPNLGINLVNLQAGLQYYWSSLETPYEHKSKIEVPFKRFHPFVQMGLGASARISRGPVFPVYALSTGLQWRYHKRAFMSAALEYSLNTAVYAFRVHNHGAALPLSEFNRYAFWLNHEFLFGRIGFQTLGGLYLNQHVEQRSIFATGVGFNGYLKNPYSHPRHQFWLGLHVRAYMGLADYVSVQLGYGF